MRVDTKKAGHWRTDAFELGCWRRLLRIPWTARRSNQSILKEINPEYSLKEMMLKLKLQYFEEPFYWKRTWCWERLKAGDGDDRGRDGRMAWPTQWTWIWASSRSWWWIGKPGMLQSTGSQRVGHNWGLNWTELNLPLSTLLTALPCHHSSHARHAPLSVCLLQVPPMWNVLLTSLKFPSCSIKVSAQMSPHAEDFPSPSKI